MNSRSFWNEVCKQGVLLGIVMGGSKILEQSLLINGSLSSSGWIVLEWILFAVLFFAILYRATKRRAALMDPVLGYSFTQGVNYMMLISILAAVPVACIYYVYINSIVGYDNYIDSIVATLISAVETLPVDNQTSDTIDMLIEQLRAQSQPSIFTTLFDTIVQYAFVGLFAGLILSGFTKRRPEIFSKSDEQ